MSTTVSGEGPWIASMPSDVDAYHVDPDCDALAQGTSPRTATQAIIEWHELRRYGTCGPTENNQPAIGGDGA